MSYIRNLKVILCGFVISVQRVRNEKLLETSATQALIFIDEAQRDITMEKLIDIELRPIKTNNDNMNEIQNCQTTVDFWENATKNPQNLTSNLKQAETASQNQIM